VSSSTILLCQPISVVREILVMLVLLAALGLMATLEMLDHQVPRESTDQGDQT
jgi:hypothetical protein